MLTEGPHLYYVDPVNKVLKGEIPWSQELRPEAKNFKTFFVHTVSLSLWTLVGSVTGERGASAGSMSCFVQGAAETRAVFPVQRLYINGTVLSWAGRYPVLVF